MLSVCGISKTFASRRGPVCALRQASLEVSAGQFVAIRGPSGSGKSTLLLMCGGLLEPDAGRVLVLGEDLYAMSPDRRAAFRARSVGFVFQRFHLVPYLSVRENVLVASLALKRDDAVWRADELLDRLGLAHRAEHVPAQLSTGERQRVALARAMLNRPKLLLADEPTGNLDPENGRVVLEHLGEYAAGGGAVLLVTHDPAAAEFAQVSMGLDKGLLRATTAVGDG